jgi:threonine/homoserine/homoserine lactone efflux protein
MPLSAFLFQVILISLSGVMSPGPMTAVVVGRSARSPHAGARIALGHGLVETPLILLLLLGFGSLMNRPLVRPVFSLAGAAVLAFMAFGMFKTSRQADIQPKEVTGSDIAAGAAISLGNPFFIVWWATIGIALIMQARDYGFWPFALFIIVHWSCDFIWYWFLSFLGFNGGKFFGQAFQRSLFIACGIFLFYVAFRFFREGLALLHGPA